MNDTNGSTPNGNTNAQGLKNVEMSANELGRAAATIFVTSVVSEVVEETARLEEAINEQKPLLESFDKVEIRFGASDAPFQGLASRVGAMPIEHRFRMIRPECIIASALDGCGATYESENTHIITANLSNATLHRTEAGVGFFGVHIQNCNAIPLCALKSGVIVRSNQTAGVFHETNRLKLVVKVLTNGKTRFLITLVSFLRDRQYDCCSVYRLLGEIKNLTESDEAALAAEDGPAVIKEFIYSGTGILSPNAVFVPTTLLGDTHLHHVNMATKARSDTIIGENHESNVSRLKIMEALGTWSDLLLLQKNSALKERTEVLSRIREEMDSVIITHDHGSTSLRLSDGQLVQEFNDNDPFGPSEFPAWVINAREQDVEQFSDMYSPELFVSGVKLGAAGESQKFEPYATVKCTQISPDSDSEKYYVVTEVVFRLDRIEKTLKQIGIDCRCYSMNFE